MADNRKLLDLLRSELEYLDRGGYDQPECWRVPLIFEDSPTCPNFMHCSDRVPCSACPLAAFVPTELRTQEPACRFVPLNARGETIDLLYNWGTPAELEMAVRNWLVTTIGRLEDKVWQAVIDQWLTKSHRMELLPGSAGDAHLLPAHRQQVVNSSKN